MEPLVDLQSIRVCANEQEGLVVLTVPVTRKLVMARMATDARTELAPDDARRLAKTLERAARIAHKPEHAAQVRTRARGRSYPSWAGGKGGARHDRAARQLLGDTTHRRNQDKKPGERNHDRESPRPDETEARAQR